MEKKLKQDETQINIEIMQARIVYKKFWKTKKEDVISREFELECNRMLVLCGPRWSFSLWLRTVVLAWAIRGETRTSSGD